MSKKDREIELTINYETLGTISLDEFKQAFWEDIQMLRDEFGVAYVKGAKIVIPATNEYGDPLQIRRLSNGAAVRQLDTHHYHPACLDYKL
jgi:hypothetical protein